MGVEGILRNPYQSLDPGRTLIRGMTLDRRRRLSCIDGKVLIDRCWKEGGRRCLWPPRRKCHQRRIDRGGPRGDLIRVSRCTTRVHEWWSLRCRSSVARVSVMNMLGMMLKRNVSPRHSMIDQIYTPIALVRLLCLASQTLKSQTAAHHPLKSPQRSLSRDCCTLGWQIRCPLSARHGKQKK
jgi:hypothetical protein